MFLRVAIDNCEYDVHGILNEGKDYLIIQSGFWRIVPISSCKVMPRR